jgi:hypothetical protein
MIARGWSIWALAVVLGACSGGGMQEREPDEMTSSGGTATETAQPSSPGTATAAQPQAEPADLAGYRDELGSAVRQGWTPPGRDSRTPPRIGVVTVHLGPRGRLESWEWRRRSPQGPFNDSISDHMDQLVNEPSRMLPLPPDGSELRREVLQDGVDIQFADPDA